MDESIEDDIDWDRRNEKEVRNLIFERYWRVAVAIINAKRNHIPRYLDPAVIESAAHIGFVDAIDRFDPAVAKFTTYLGVRIKYAILDTLRLEDRYTRAHRRLANERERSEQQLTQSLGRIPSREEVQADLGWNDELYSLSKDVQTMNITDEDPEGKRGRNERIDVSSLQVVKRVTRPKLTIELAETFREMAKGLDFDEQTILYLYYHRDATMKNIGLVLGISESRVSQMHKHAIAKLRKLGRDRMLEAMGHRQ